jgi:uncharacterized protein
MKVAAMTDLTSNPLHRPVDRRRLLQGALALGAGAALGPFGALGDRVAHAANSLGRGGRTADGGYGPIAPVKDQTTGLELLLLPRGFEYLSFGWTNDRMSDGRPTPSNHDGMAAFRHGDRVHLVRNHEKGNGAPFAAPSATYDPTSSGGTTTLVFDPDQGRLVDSYASLSGTIRNCAGGPTPEGTWLSCEETTQVNAGDVRHGYVFEVPSAGVADAVPLKAMGRFSHEATATDPATGYIYETEDTGDSLLYRFRPNDRFDLKKGGVLEAMVLDEPMQDTRRWETGQRASVTRWVEIPVPDPAVGAPTTRAQGQLLGAAIITRGEGIWYGDGVVYVVASNGGPAGQGQVFALDLAANTFTAILSSPSSDVLNAPDNICVSPRGGLVVCEDGSGVEFMHGMTTGGDIFKFAGNNVGLDGFKGFSGNFTGSEWCGATFEPKNGNWLFANIQNPGFTVAITGPWRQGAL